ncbi:unnamed protein product [Heterobilharzia americana]|nr:unnamed protein product [Heterobilharzia americana]
MLPISRRLVEHTSHTQVPSTRLYDDENLSCYSCEFCPEVKPKTLRQSGCKLCITAGANKYIFRGCIGRQSTLPVNFPKVFRKFCGKNLCNNETSDNYIQNPVSCYTCEGCTTSNQKIVDFCGGCVIVRGPGYINKYCNNSCSISPHEEGTSCCATELCNGMSKFVLQTNVVLFSLVFTGICAFF